MGNTMTMIMDSFKLQVSLPGVGYRSNRQRYCSFSGLADVRSNDSTPDIYRMLVVAMFTFQLSQTASLGLNVLDPVYLSTISDGTVIILITSGSFARNKHGNGQE